MTKTLLAVLCLSVALVAAPEDGAPVAAAAMRHDAATVRALLKAGKDVNAAQGDGMTALHWAAMNGDADLTAALLYAGANVRATTRLGGYTPLHLAAQAGQAGAVGRLIAGGASTGATTSTGATALMLASASGNADAVKLLLEQQGDVNAVESANGETALMFAAALDRGDAVRALLEHGADPARASKTVDLTGVVAPEDALQTAIRDAQNAKSASATGVARPAAPPPATSASRGVAGMTRPYAFNELIGVQGGLTALHFAARQGSVHAVQALVEKGADVNAVCSGDRVSPLLIATVNGQFDIATYLIEHGADPNLANVGGVAPLFEVLNIEWAPRTLYPQPRAQLQQRASYLDLMTLLLDRGADPNARLIRKTWFTQYNFELLHVDDGGATPFWRAAYASDIPAMKLLLSYGADPNVSTMKPFSRPRGTDADRDAPAVERGLPIPTGGPGVPPLLAAAGPGYGEGFAANAHRYAPTGMLAAVTFLVEEMHADVNARDHEGNTALHNAASRGDNAMIEYLVSKGADVTAVNRAGQTTVDMANGPVQRTQPYPDTIALLEKLGAKNNHKCVSC
jgi:ankyrin repeat protein